MSHKIPDTITEEELKQIVRGIKNHKKKLAYMLGFYQCMRVSEVVALKSDNVDINRRFIYIKDAKGGKDRNIPIAPEVLKGLRYLPVGGTRRALQYSFKKTSKEIIGKDLSFHSLRHSGATHYLNKKKWNIRAVQQFLGHARLTTTQIYTHINNEELLKEMWKE